MAIEDLANIRKKLAWAYQQREKWDSAFDAWTESNPYNVEGIPRPDGWFWVKLVELKPMPDDLTLLFADYIHNLRSVLDHIAHALTPNASEHVYFPVVNDGKDWRSSHMGKIPNFPAHWLDRVKDAQPFQYGSRFREHPLYILHHLDIREKHRFIVPMRLVFIKWSPQFAFNRMKLPGEWVHEVHRPQVGFLQGGDVLVRLRPISKNDDLRITHIIQVDEIEGGFGPASDVTSWTGKWPNIDCFVGTLLESLVGAF